MNDFGSLLGPSIGMHASACCTSPRDGRSGVLLSLRPTPSSPHTRSRSWGCLDPLVQQPAAQPLDPLEPCALEDLPSSVLLSILQLLPPEQVAVLKQCSSAMYANVAAACEGWRSKVEQHCHSITNGTELLGALMLEQHVCANHPSDGRPRRRDWLCVWTCLQRAQQGPWNLDVTHLSRSAAPEGVLLVLELLLPPVEVATTATTPAAELPGATNSNHSGSSSSSSGQPGDWKDPIPVASLMVDAHPVQVVVEPSGRVTSPQLDWAQGSIVLQPGVPQLVALEVSYICPVPSWSLHPCRKQGSSLSLDLQQGCGSYVHDPRFLERPNSDGAAALASQGVQGCVVGAGCSLNTSTSSKPAPNKVVALLNRLLPGKGARGAVAAARAQRGAAAKSRAGADPAHNQHQVRKPASADPAAGGTSGSAGTALSSSRRRGGYALTCTGLSRDSSGNPLATRSGTWGPSGPTWQQDGASSGNTALPVAVVSGSAWALPDDPALRFHQGYIASFAHQKLLQLLRRYSQLDPSTNTL